MAVQEETRTPPQLRLTDPGWRVCSKCGSAKPPAEFEKKGARCRACRAAYDRARPNKEARRAQQRAWGKRNKDAVRAYKRARYQRSKDAVRAYREAHREHIRKAERTRRLARRYGITAEDYDLILAAQGGGCYICGRSVENDGRRLCVDHDHATGEVRGILCRHHNTAIGLLRDREQWARRTIEYLQLPRRWWGAA